MNKKNVYELVQERLDLIFKEFDNIYISFSGGKDSVVYSMDGVNLSLVHEKKYSSSSFTSICYKYMGSINRRYIATKASGEIAYSDDIHNWITVNVVNTQLNSICYGNEKCVAVGENGVIAYSTDGENWFTKNVGNTNWKSVCYGDGGFVAVGNSGAVAYSTDGEDWTTTKVENYDLNGICPAQ